MPPIKQVPPLTEEEKYKCQIQADKELSRLKREYALLERDRYQYAPNIKVLRLNNVLKLTRKEHYNILQDLEVADGAPKHREITKLNSTLHSLLTQHDIYCYKVKKEKQYIEEIDEQIKNVQKDVVKLRTNQVNDKQYEQRTSAAVKTIETLENKLEVQTKKFGSVCMELKSMRTEIEGLLWERKGFIKIWNKMINKLALGKRFMMDLIDQATFAYDQREEWCNKLHTLRSKVRHDVMMHSEAMSELERKKDNYKKLIEFFEIKGRKRVVKDLIRKEHIKRQERKERLNKRMEKFKGMMDEILEFTRESQVDVIARKYYNREAENFMRFSYVIDLIREMEGVNDKLSHLYMEIEDEIAVRDMRAKQQKSTLEDLENELQQVQNNYDISKIELKTCDEYIEKMLEGIDTIFKLCQCNKDPLLELLDDNTTVNEFNVMLYLELIEKKIHNALLELYYRKNNLNDEKTKVSIIQKIKRENENKSTIYPLETIAGSSPCPLCFESEMVSDVVDSVQVVLSRDQAKKQIITRLGSSTDIQRVHNVSDCNLPKSRDIMQKRYL